MIYDGEGKGGEDELEEKCRCGRRKTIKLEISVGVRKAVALTKKKWERVWRGADLTTPILGGPAPLASLMENPTALHKPQRRSTRCSRFTNCIECSTTVFLVNLFCTSTFPSPVFLHLSHLPGTGSSLSY